MAWYDDDCYNIADKALSKLANGKPYTMATLVKDLNPDINAIRQALMKSKNFNNPDNYNRVNVGPGATVAQLREQYYKTALWDLDDTDA